MRAKITYGPSDDPAKLPFDFSDNVMFGFGVLRGE